MKLSSLILIILVSSANGFSIVSDVSPAVKISLGGRDIKAISPVSTVVGSLDSTSQCSKGKCPFAFLHNMKGTAVNMKVPENKSVLRSFDNFLTVIKINLFAMLCRLRMKFLKPQLPLRTKGPSSHNPELVSKAYSTMFGDPSNSLSDVSMRQAVARRAAENLFLKVWTSKANEANYFHKVFAQTVWGVELESLFGRSVNLQAWNVVFSEFDKAVVQGFARTYEMIMTGFFHKESSVKFLAKYHKGLNVDQGLFDFAVENTFKSLQLGDEYFNDYKSMMDTKHSRAGVIDGSK